MTLKGLHILLTYQCTYECDHCFVKSSPNAEGTFTLAQARNAIDQAAELNSIEWIFLEGGEPFLFFPVMIELVKHTKNLGFSVGIVTNGYYGNTIEDAACWLKPLKKVGLDSLSVSIDEFHQGDGFQSSPAQKTREAAEQIGLAVGTIAIEKPCEISNPHTPGLPILGGDVRFRGRAADKLINEQLPKFHWESFDKCPDEDWVDITRLHVDSYGNLFACQGIVLGNLNNDNLKSIIDNYSPEKHPIINPIHKGGPAELLRRYVLSSLEGKYHDPCHLCFLVRRKLRSKYPELLAPEQVY